MSAEEQIRAWQAKLERRLQDIVVNVGFKMRDSVADGPKTRAGQLTGAPGQPVDVGNLRAMWYASLDISTPLLAKLIATGEAPNGEKVGYAEPIEEGIGPHGPMTLRSEVGGFHSVKMTRNNFDKLVDQAVREEVHD